MHNENVFLFITDYWTLSDGRFLKTNLYLVGLDRMPKDGRERRGSRVMRLVVNNNSSSSKKDPDGNNPQRKPKTCESRIWDGESLL